MRTRYIFQEFSGRKWGAVRANTEGEMNDKDNAARADNRVVPDAHTRQNNRARTDPAASSDLPQFSYSYLFSYIQALTYK